MNRKLIKKKAKAITKKAMAVLASAVKAVRAQKLATLHTFALLWLVIRVEQLHSVMTELLANINALGFILLINIQQANEQFKAAILSILSLFGGEPS